MRINSSSGVTSQCQENNTFQRFLIRNVIKISKLASDLYRDASVGWFVLTDCGLFCDGTGDLNNRWDWNGIIAENLKVAKERKGVLRLAMNARGVMLWIRNSWDPQFVSFDEGQFLKN